MKNILYTLILSLLISSCSNLKNSLGLVAVAPNEHEVKTVKPVKVPKKFDLPEPKLVEESTPAQNSKLETTSNLIERKQ
ncbi:MAG: hypothetical protein K0Q51_765 [Rickettsiaceae bacterium]|jgi:hypothetical protein|nr:hypothetical protein [Rickettsiaceae bacterium]